MLAIGTILSPYIVEEVNMATFYKRDSGQRGRMRRGIVVEAQRVGVRNELDDEIMVDELS